MKLKSKAYRQTSPTRDPLSQVGAINYGGRWNIKEAFGALYLALSKTALKAEIKSAMKRAGLEESVYFPRKIAETSIILSRVIDFRKAETRKKWGLTLADIQSLDWHKCQSVAGKVREAGYEGIVFPSATGVGANIAVFRDRLSEKSLVEIMSTREVASLKEIA
ncbi:MAG: RES family NAD+ phosphorylase [Candidatus Tritonobacter lacicola]|nr:RES family NAD+ phosphorylase [Candidatus Tritonobacter lacicola]